MKLEKNIHLKTELCAILYLSRWRRWLQIKQMIKTADGWTSPPGPALSEASGLMNDKRTWSSRMWLLTLIIIGTLISAHCVLFSGRFLLLFNDALLLFPMYSALSTCCTPLPSSIYACLQQMVGPVHLRCLFSITESSTTGAQL